MKRVVSSGELLTAPTDEALVTMLRLSDGYRRKSNPPVSDKEFMKEVAERALEFDFNGGHVIRTNNATNFLADMNKAGLLVIVEKETVWSDKH